MRRASFSRILLTLSLIAWNSCAKPAEPQANLDARVDALLAQMTLEEKVGQLNLVQYDRSSLEQAVAAGKVGSIIGFMGVARTNNLQRFAIEHSRLHIPLLFGGDVVHGYRTIFPIPLGLASAWDPSVVETMGRILSLIHI